jgi:hypothetical protein
LFAVGSPVQAGGSPDCRWPCLYASKWTTLVGRVVVSPGIQMQVCEGHLPKDCMTHGAIRSVDVNIKEGKVAIFLAVCVEVDVTV